MNSVCLTSLIGTEPRPVGSRPLTQRSRGKDVPLPFGQDFFFGGGPLDSFSDYF